MKKIISGLVVGLLVSFGSGNAGAINFRGEAWGSWDTPVYETGGQTHTTIQNWDQQNGKTASILWGVPANCSGQSYLKFDGAGSEPDNSPADWTQPPSPFVLGTLDYYNGVQYVNTGISGVLFDLNVTILDPNVGLLNTFTYKMQVNNTINPNGDTVLEMPPLPSPQQFNDGAGNLYWFTLNGFSRDNGQSFVTSLYANEERHWRGALYGSITPAGSGTPVPDGGSTMALAGLAIAGLALLRAKIN